jgi:hypothetical protein
VSFGVAQHRRESVIYLNQMIVAINQVRANRQVTEFRLESFLSDLENFTHAAWR